MGLASFNRMRLRRIEEMKPENITKEESKLVAKDEAIVNTVVEEQEKEEVKEETKETVTRGSKRKSK